jgi:hypothetical protein
MKPVQCGARRDPADRDRDASTTETGFSDMTKELWIVNTYDPADHIVYVHMTREEDPYAIPVASNPTCSRLPSGYANRSLRTALVGELHDGRPSCLREQGKSQIRVPPGQGVTCSRSR